MMAAYARSELAASRARAIRSEADALRARAAAIRRQADLLMDRLLESLRRSDGRPFGDRGDGAFSLRLVRRPQAVSFVRNDLRRWLELDGVAREEALEIALACSEACSNAVEHAHAPRYQAFEVSAWREHGEVVLVVRDFGNWTDSAGLGDTRGRGLQMIRAIMDDVEVTQSGDGTELTMRRSLHRGLG
jgi:anti-sigma regulatory factor (Ser/Thr protein kinase)